MILFLALSCAPTVDVVTWDTVDVDEVDLLLDSPTATSDELAGQEAEVYDDLEAAAELSALPGEGLEEYLAPPGSDPVPDDALTSGTSIYLEIACPGLGEGPDPEFRFGAVRVESPLLSSAEQILLLGPLFVELSACELGSSELSGELSATWLADEQRLVAGGSVRFGGDAPADLLLDVGLSRSRIGIPLGEGRATLEISGEVLLLRFADGDIGCVREADGSVDCSS